MTRVPPSAAAFVAALALAGSASALDARDTAATGAAGSWSVGVFNPLRYAWSDRLEMETHPLFFLVAPHATARWSFGTFGGWRVTGEGSLSAPAGLELLSGYLLESNAVSKDPALGWFVVPGLGVVASRGGPSSPHVWTARLESAFGVPLSSGRPTPRDSWPFLNLLFAPMTNGWRARAGVAHDHAIRPWLRARAELNAWLVGAAPDGYAALSPFTASAHFGLDFAVGARSRFTVGAYWYNYDNHEERVVEKDGFASREAVRSNDFYPSIDFIFAGGR